MPRKEQTIESAVVAQAEAAGWETRKMQYVGRVGCKDRVFFRPGRFLWIEFKRPGQLPDPIQAREIGRFRDAGQEVFVVSSTRQAREILELP